jgi:hypothetical protein
MLLFLLVNLFLTFFCCLDVQPISDAHATLFAKVLAVIVDIDLHAARADELLLAKSKLFLFRLFTLIPQLLLFFLVFFTPLYQAAKRASQTLTG